MEELRQAGAIEGWRDELYPVTESFNEQPLLLVERAAATYLGIKVVFWKHLPGLLPAGAEICRPQVVHVQPQGSCNIHVQTSHFMSGCQRTAARVDCAGC